MDFRISGKRALVLASSRGLGAAIAEALAAEGVNVLLCGRSGDRLEALAAKINAQGKGKADWVWSDLAEPDAVATLTAAVKDRFGGLDILVNNTGGPVPGTTQDMSADRLESYFQSMVLSVISLTNALLPDLTAQGWGRIVTVASSGVIEPIAGLALSNTLRGALVGWNKTLSAEVAGHGVTANMLLPGRILTDRIEELDGARARHLGESIETVRAASIQAIPAGRLGTPAEFAAAAAFLCSQQAAYITGTMVRIDGGAAKSF